MSSVLIKNARLVDPSQGVDETRDILILDGKVAEAGAEIPAGIEEYDATGKIVTPGLMDMHVHFREPGMEEKETVVSGAAAAAAGGFTTVACMPNTEPALDSEAHMNFVLRESRLAGMAEVLPVGAITAGRKGEELAEMANMARGGAVAFSDDGSSVPSAAVLKQAMLYAKMLDKPILEHCDEPTLAEGGVMNESFVSTTLGLPGIPAESEEIIIARDIYLAKLTGARLHVQHISSRGSVELIRRAKSEGIEVTAEVCPHHLTLSEDNLKSFDPVYKVAPPLRSQDDVDACIAGLADGTIDVIASDHAPHLHEEKELELAYAPCGMIGLETTVGVLMNDLVHTGKLELSRMVAAMTCAVEDILRIDRGSLRAGMAGNITVIDPDLEWVVNPDEFRSKSRNCPWAGKTLRGRAVATFVEGRKVFSL